MTLPCLLHTAWGERATAPYVVHPGRGPPPHGEQALGASLREARDANPQGCCRRRQSVSAARLARPGRRHWCCRCPRCRCGEAEKLIENPVKNKGVAQKEDGQPQVHHDRLPQAYAKPPSQ